MIATVKKKIQQYIPTHCVLFLLRLSSLNKWVSYSDLTFDVDNNKPDLHFYAIKIYFLWRRM